VFGIVTRLRAYRHFRRHHTREVGRPPRLLRPVTLNEHILHRMLFDRDPRLKIVSDKIAVKALIAEKAGPAYVVPLLGKWDRAEDIAWASLPSAFVLKPNQTSGPFELIANRDAADIPRLTAVAREWLDDSRPTGTDINYEWGYQGIKRQVMAEPLLRGAGGEPIGELSVFVFHGRSLLLRRFAGQKLTSGRRDSWFDRRGRRLAIASRKIETAVLPLAHDMREEAVAVSDRVAAGFTHMRVDFYLTSEGLKIGELTPYSWGGYGVFVPPETDALLGRLWQNPDTSIFADYVPPSGRAGTAGVKVAHDRC